MDKRPIDEAALRVLVNLEELLRSLADEESLAQRLERRRNPEEDDADIEDNPGRRFCRRN